MSDGQSRAYFERRAEQERVAAQQAASEPAAQRHRELAAQYRRLVLAAGPRGRKFADAAEGATLPDGFRLIP